MGVSVSYVVGCEGLAMSRLPGDGVEAVHETCQVAPGAHWNRYLKGSGALELTPETWRLVQTDVSCRGYTDAQLDDYQGLSRKRFLWRPPLRMRIRARFSHGRDELRGTAGFGFWNDPFLMTGWRPPALPRAVWFFFASPPSDMVLDSAVPGHGWKAMVLDALRLPFIVSLPLLPVVAMLMNVRVLRRWIWPPFQRAVRGSESLLDVDMRTWHTYEINWMPASTSFSIDGRVVLDGVPAPTGPLGFVVWLDNQYAVITPWGRLGYGLLKIVGRQWLEIGEIHIEPLQVVSGASVDKLAVSRRH